jgi:hypothetical protein
MTTDELKALEYPRHLHRPSVPGDWVFLVVRDHHEAAAALADNWSLTPIIIGHDDGPPPPVDSRSGDSAVEPPRKHLGWPKGKQRKGQP